MAFKAQWISRRPSVPSNTKAVVATRFETEAICLCFIPILSNSETVR